MVDVKPPEIAKGDGASSAKPRSKLALVFKILASGGLVAWIISTANLSEVLEAWKSVDPRWMAVAVVLQFLGAALISIRWQGLLAVQQVVLRLSYLYGSVLVANFFRQFLPSIIGGDVIRGHDAWRAGSPWPVALMSLLLDRLLGLLALALLAMTAVFFSDDMTDKLVGLKLWLVVAFAVICLVLSLLLFSRPQKAPRRTVSLLPEKVSRKLTAIGDAVSMYKGRQRAIWRGLGFSLLLQVNVVTFYWALSQALGLDVDYWSWFVIAPIAIFVMMVPLSINGIGVREAIFIFLLSQWGVPNSTALALAWMEYGVFLAFGLFGGVVYSLRRT